MIQMIGVRIGNNCRKAYKLKIINIINMIPSDLTRSLDDIFYPRFLKL